MKTITIIGAGMMGSALAYPAFENGNEVRLVGTPLDRDIIDGCIKDNKHLKFDIPFPQGIKYYQFEDWKTAVEGADFVIGGVSSFGVDWFLTVWRNVQPKVGLQKYLNDNVNGGMTDLFSMGLEEKLGSGAARILSKEGHLVVRVNPGGESYYIYSLSDKDESMNINERFGPYKSR